MQGARHTNSKTKAKVGHWGWCSRGVNGLRHAPVLAAVRTARRAPSRHSGPSRWTSPRRACAPGRREGAPDGAQLASRACSPPRRALSPAGCANGDGLQAHCFHAGHVQQRLSTRMKVPKEDDAAGRRAEGRVRPWGAAAARNVRSCAAGGVRHATQGGRRWPLRAPTEAVVAGHVKDGRVWTNQERRHDEGRWGGASLASRGPQERRPAPASALPRLPESVLR